MIQNLHSEKLSIVVPVYNEEENVSLLVSRIEGALQGKNYEIILVDDGSTDQTKANIRQLNNPNVALIELKKKLWPKFGYGSGN